MIADTNTAHFRATGLEVPLPPGWHYIDEGPSRSNIFSDPGKDGYQTIEGRSLDIMIRHEIVDLVLTEGITPQEAQPRAEQEALASLGMPQRLFFGHRLGSTLLYGPVDYGQGPLTYVHVLYLDEGTPEVNFQIRAHEEFHAITMIPGALERLEEKIVPERGRPIRFDKIKDEELAADCNAVHLFRQQGIDLLAVLAYHRQQDINLEERFARAIHIYDTDEYSRLSFLSRNFRSRAKALFI